ncbi:MAG: hypothetical protein ACRD1T_11170, partial [Acidimicrobiia bacterium]
GRSDHATGIGAGYLVLLQSLGSVEARCVFVTESPLRSVLSITRRLGSPSRFASGAATGG